MAQNHQKLSLEELNRDDINSYKLKNKLPIVIVLDNIRSMHNIGSIFRTSDAFLIEEIHLCGITSTPPNKEIHKTALGATESVQWRYFDSTQESINLLRNESYQIISVEQATNSTSLEDFIPSKDQKMAFIFGNEVKGVQQGIVNQSDLCLEIPQFGTKHSLNISVSAAIIIWHTFQIMSQIQSK